MPARLVALDEGPDILLDRPMIVVGRHPQCDARLDSLRVSRHHCCMIQDKDEVVVRDLGSTNGIRINGQRVEMGRLRSGDELSIAHIRYRLDTGVGHEATLADHNHNKAEANDGPPASLVPAPPPSPSPLGSSPFLVASANDNPLAAAVRELLPAGVADRCRIKVIVEMHDEKEDEGGAVENLDA
ncbi:MAG: FHA domain-containing protein [Planctomycetaceae bacterium]|nr:FHA domain-containing protein [Planctomycetaceae bacterium]